MLLTPLFLAAKCDDEPGCAPLNGIDYHTTCDATIEWIIASTAIAEGRCPYEDGCQPE